MRAQTSEATDPRDSEVAGTAGCAGPRPGRGVAGEALEDALGRAYRFLAPRDRTIAELRRHLDRAGLAPGLIDACVSELVEQRYLDDERFARRFTEDRRTLDGWGRERIRGRLLALGIAAECAERMTGGRDGEEELAAAIELLRRRLRGAPTDERGRGRALGLLVRRGYELELAHDAIRRFAHEAGTGT